MATQVFHPALRRWFDETFDAPTPAQVRAWPSIGQGQHTLISAPTGSGKTLAAFLSAIDGLLRAGLEGRLEPHLQVIYVSPLKALSNDIHHNLQRPLAGIAQALEAMDLPAVDIRVGLRTGDTPSKERQAALRHPPHIYVTTPESLYILLTSEKGRGMLKTAHTVIVDEIHAVVGDKRGSHLALTLERLDALAGRPLTRIGLSATQRPIEIVGRYLAGGSPEKGLNIVDLGHKRRLDMALELPPEPLTAVMANTVWERLYDRLAELVLAHRTTLIFVNTRRLAERVARNLADRLGKEAVTAHHGSLSKETRLDAEVRLKGGSLRALVATASLEMGIDIGEVELVCQMGSPGAISTLLQRVGRSGHAVGETPKGRIFPLTLDELVECAALLEAVEAGELETLRFPEAPLDILAQQIVAAAASEDWALDDLYGVMAGAYPYRDLSREAFDEIVEMLGQGFSTRRGRRGAYLHVDGVGGRVRGRRGARLAAITNGGSIPDLADYDVVMEDSGQRVGSVHEDFAIESMPGDVFQLGNTSWRITKVALGKVKVQDARGEPPTIPFWLGEAPSRSPELSQAVSRLRGRLDGALEAGARGDAHDGLVALGVTEGGASQLLDFMEATRLSLGAIPTQETLILERFFDQTGGMQLVLHAPFGSRLNRAWGLALRKRFCRSFNFELQAAAVEDAIVLSLGHTHSFPLEEVFDFLSPKTVTHVLTQALLDAPMFTTRWRWNLGRSLAVLRFKGGRRNAPQIQRFEAEDMISVIFPDQLACQENVQGEREIPDHPLVQQTLRDCLEEAMDIHGLTALLEAMASGEKTLIARDVTRPSPMAQGVLNARPYAFLDDAPLEERRTQAVLGGRWALPEDAQDLAALSPEAIATVVAQAFPDARDPDELHDALMTFGPLTEAEGLGHGRPADAPPGSWAAHLDALTAGHRGTRLIPAPGAAPLWVCAEALSALLPLYPEGRLSPEIPLPGKRPPFGEVGDPDATVKALLRGRLEGVGPAFAEELAQALALEVGSIRGALAALEQEGFVMRGAFRPRQGAGAEPEWCERHLLARIHRRTVGGLRKAISPVTLQAYQRFLLRWQRVLPDERAEGPEGLAAVLEQLAGFGASAAAWEASILPARMGRFSRLALDELCRSGRFTFLRLSPPEGGVGQTARATPLAFVPRADLDLWIQPLPEGAREALSPRALSVLALLETKGALFFGEICREAGLLGAEAEGALGELFASGFVTADGFAGLRALLVPQAQRPTQQRRGRRPRPSGFGSSIEGGGRWSVLPRGGEGALGDDDMEAIAHVLLGRYGVIFAQLLQREVAIPPWRQLLRALWRLEARGEIRGGRFIEDMAGEQFALPEAVPLLRRGRETPLEGPPIGLSAADPLNLVGVLDVGARLPATGSNALLYEDGLVVSILKGGDVEHRGEVTESLGRERLRLLHGGGPGPSTAGMGRRLTLASAKG